MKFTAAITLLALVHSADALKSVGVSFGPKNCVNLARSTSGSCVLSTSCEGIDTSHTEFAFDCIGENGKGDVVRHSFGVGGFESSEEFDTEVKCGRCASVSHENEYPTAAVRKVEAILKPAPTPKPQPKHEEVKAVMLKAKAKAKTAAAVEQQASWNPFSGGGKAKENSGAVKYGPAGCVSTWRNAEGHCIMSTKCNKDDIANYEFGLVCVDKTGSPVKHLFGKDSFDSKETFDTLIKCDQCLGLEDIPDTVSLAGEVASMAKDVDSLKDVMKNISINVNMLNKAVFKTGAAAPGPAAAGPAPAAPAKTAKFLVHRAASHRHHHHGNLRHSHHRHHRRHRRQEDDDDDERREEDDRDDRDDRDDDGWSEEPTTNAVDDINSAAVRLQQAQADRAAEQARVQYIPMNQASTDTNKASVAPIATASAARDDDEDDDEDDSDE